MEMDIERRPPTPEENAAVIRLAEGETVEESPGKKPRYDGDLPFDGEDAKDKTTTQTAEDNDYPGPPPE